MNKPNLLKLADYLEKNVTQNMFDMSRFRADNNRPLKFKSINDCGTVGCALGYGPFVKGLEVKDVDFTLNSYDELSLDFINYGNRVLDVHGFSSDWDFMFGAGWQSCDNTPLGAAKRIRYVVANEGAHEDFDESIFYFMEDSEKYEEEVEKKEIRELIINEYMK